MATFTPNKMTDRPRYIYIDNLAVAATTNNEDVWSEPIDVSNVKYMEIAVRASASHSWDINLRQYPTNDDGTSIVGSISSGTNSSKRVDEQHVCGRYAMIQIDNNDGTPRTYDVMVKFVYYGE